MSLTEETFQTSRSDLVSNADVVDFWQLLKPRVMSLVVFTGLVGMVLAPGTLHPVLAAVALLCIAVGAGASGALNMWYDADIDAVMRRTARRPVPAGRVLPGEALAFGLSLSAFSVAILGIAVNWLAAGLLAFTIFFYVAVYTMWLKRWTAQNIVIGGAAGALPPVIGWASVTGGVSLEPLVLFMIIFLWTPPHFWALALFRREDYARAGVPMMPNIAGDASTRNQIVLYAIAIAPVAIAPWFFGFAGPVYGIVSALLSLEFIRRAVKLRSLGDADNYRAAKSLFGFSILYLFLLFAVLLVEALAVRIVGA
ncbi:MAG TPA: heme o synthase [Afifellaceae bacterium]|nr:heme o synthase [Afifellaceae bacterium]